MEVLLPIRDAAIVASLLPQKEPIVMVHSLLHYDVLELLSGFEIKADNIFVQEGRLQASGLLEHMAQSVALHTGYTYFLKGETPPTGYIGAIKTFEVDYLPEIGAEIYSEVNILSEIMGVTLVAIKTKYEDTFIAYSQMKTVIKPPND